MDSKIKMQGGKIYNIYVNNSDENKIKKWTELPETQFIMVLKLYEKDGSNFRTFSIILLLTTVL